MRFFPGLKTYTIAVLMVAYAVAGFYLHQMNQEQATTLVLQGLGLGFMRAGISKVGRTIV